MRGLTLLIATILTFDTLRRPSRHDVDERRHSAASPDGRNLGPCRRRQPRLVRGMLAPITVERLRPECTI